MPAVRVYTRQARSNCSMTLTPKVNKSVYARGTTSNPLFFCPATLIMRALQVHRRVRMLFRHRQWLRVYHGPDNDGKCAATRALNAHLPAQIRGIRKEWRHTPVGYRSKSQTNPSDCSNGLIHQCKKHDTWAEALLLSQYWWHSEASPLVEKIQLAPK